jgi:hypothetical protein
MVMAIYEDLGRYFRDDVRAQTCVLYAAGPSREEVDDDEMLRLAPTKEAC